MNAARFLERLRRRTPIEAPAAIVVAHPDDETIGAGASLALLHDLTLVHVTDGAPHDLRDAQAAGFETAKEYAAARRRELREALHAAGAEPRCVELAIADQDATRHVPEIAAALRTVLAQAALVITHALEGGHPDHDACALAVRQARAMLVDPPAMLEFPAYRIASDGHWVLQCFPPDEPQGETMPLTQAEVARKRAALVCFTTQRATLAQFDPAREVFRVAATSAVTKRLPLPSREGAGWRGGAARLNASESATPDPSPQPPPAMGGGVSSASFWPLHILLVAYPFAPVGPDAVGGAEQVLSAVDRALAAAGHRCTVVACAGSQTAGALLGHELPPGTIDAAARADVRQSVRSNIAAALRAQPIDLIHLHGIDFAEYLPPPGVPCLVTLHLPPAWYPPPALRPNRADTWLHCVSAAQQRACPASDRLLLPIPNGVPVDALSAHRHARRDFALTLGRICPEKGQHLALEAAHTAGLPLLIGGAVFPYPEHQAYFADAVIPRLDRRRRWLGPLPFARKRRLLAAARCLLVPSLAPETASLATMEALACGTPVIAYPSGALAELIEPGRTGFLVQDAAGMAAAMRRTHEIDPELCRRTARERFPLRRMTDAYLARYAALARRTRVAV